MPRTFDFVVGSLYPNTLLDISIPEPGPSSLDPIVRHLPVVYGEHKELGAAKGLQFDFDKNVVVADDRFQVSTVVLETLEEGGPREPKVLRQDLIKARTGTTWAGLIPVKAGTLSALTSGQLHLHPSASSSSTLLSRNVPSPLLAVSSSDVNATNFALAGKEVDVSVWDVEATFAVVEGEQQSSEAGGKRKKNELERGEIWRAKNMPNNSLAIRPPNHHLCLTHLPLLGPTNLASGTKSGTVRTYDTRQRKPVQEWKVAREGGVGTIAAGADEHSVFFSDRSNLLGALDLRTGRLLYSYPSMSCTPHALLPLPNTSTSSASLNLGLATICSDAALRIHSTFPPKTEGEKGNIGGGRKTKIEAIVGGVGICNPLWNGFGHVAEPPKEKKVKADGEDVGDEEDGEDDDEEVWEGMSEVEDDSSESGSEDEAPKPKAKKSRK